MRYLKEEAVTLRSKSELVRRGKGISQLREDAFDLLLPEALYWVGFLYADGHIEKDRPRITFTLSEKDKSHIEKFNQFMGGALNVREVTQKKEKVTPAPGQKNFDYKYFRISFSSLRVYNRLKGLGFTHNKTYGLAPHESLRYSRDFFRGVLDGDGWVCMSGDSRANGKYNYPIVGLSGTDETIKEFLSFIRSSGIETQASSLKKKGEVWQTDLHNAPAKKVLALLYKDSSVFLDRKYAAAMEIINSPDSGITAEPDNSLS